MISYESVLVELEKHIQTAKTASSEQQFREALAATKALCDIVLQFPVNGTSTTSIEENKQLISNPSPLPYAQERSEEDGANGTSIFDF